MSAIAYAGPAAAWLGGVTWERLGSWSMAPSIRVGDAQNSHGGMT